MAAITQQKTKAIESGLTWLAQEQQSDGRWHYTMSSTSDSFATSAALKAFLTAGYAPGQDVILGETNYGDVLGKGLDYIFANANRYSIGMQPHGNPDVNGNGYGLCLGNINQSTYNTGMTLVALAATRDPYAIVQTGSEAGRTYQDVAQDAVEFFAFGQYDSSAYRGGWRFQPNQGAGNENSPWACMGMLQAEQELGVIVPQFVKEELTYWIDYIQYRNPGHQLDGSSGFTTPTYLNNPSKTGGMLVEMVLAGYDLSDDNVQAAIGYLNREWPTAAYNTFYGHYGDPYAMIQTLKGLEVTVGLDDTTYITNLGDCGSMDDGTPANWLENHCEYLVDKQLADGSWSSYAYYDQILATAWNVDILNTSINTTPEPMTVSLFALGGMWLVRKKR
ncbi:MAG: PEP-CTERM sorting domain-containing protein [Phycisphaerae bacterium]|nr:PEP-CTERM sorting domain-containing protein [Phycisphaerae bacterium]